MTPRTLVGRSLLSICFLLAAMLLAWLLFQPANPYEPSDGPETRLKRILPQTDPLLIRRAAQNWGYTAVSAAERHGENGLHVLDAFEDEAAHCLEHQPDAFKVLAKVVQLDPARFRLAAGPWNRAVLDWAQTGKLDRFLERLNALPADRLAVAETCPNSLPLLCAGESPKACAMLEKYGDRAWRLFMAVNFTKHPQDLERVASAVEKEGDLMLRLNEDYGLPYALLLVAPATDKGSQRLPEVVRCALRTLDDEATALALIIVNLDAIKDMLDSGKTPRQLEEAIELFAGLPPVDKEFALDHANTLRLLTETWYGQKVGAEVLRRCGPAAVDLIYDRYASDDRLKLPALVSMAGLGKPAYQVFYRYRDYDKFHALLKRCEPDLMNPRDNPPAVVHAIENINREGQEKLDIYADVQNLRGEVLADVRGPLPEEAFYEWLPGYVAYRTAANYLDGRHVTGGEAFWATVDAVSTATMVYGAVVDAFKTVGRKAVNEGAELAAKKGVSQAGRTTAQKAVAGAEKNLAETMQKLAIESVKREGADLTRFGEKAGDVAVQRLEARTNGLALNLTDRREAYVKLAKAGDINGKAELVEKIGVEGAQRYSSTVGYQPLHAGPLRRGQGFDLPPYRDGNRIVVIEAKGGSAPVKTFRGHKQGTIEYTKEVAEWYKNSPITSADEKKAAEEVIKAAEEGRLYVETVRTRHVQGKPGPTQVERVTGPSGQIPLAPAGNPRTPLMQTPGMARAWVQHAGGAVNGRDVPTSIQQATGVSRRVGVSLWAQGAGPLAPRTVVRKGRPILVSPNASTLPGQVDDFAIALMERGV